MERTIKITYVGHSGFALEINDTTFIFDYFNDPGNVVENILQRSLNTVVFASHSHEDHFNPEIFEWRKKYHNVRYILSNEIRRKLKNIDVSTAANIDFIKVGESITNINVPFTVKAFGSTDCGCSFFITVGGFKIFHAGDLNNWHWSDDSTPQEIKNAENSYLKILKDIKDDTEDFDLVMFPVDSRIGSDYFRGAYQFVHTFRVKNFIPMHFWNNPEQACEFELYKKQNYGNYYCLANPGEVLTLK